MSKWGDDYRRVAIRAVDLIADKIETDPRKAWKIAAKELLPKTEKKSAEKKSCPMDTFLGLCEEGLIKGVPRGNYTTSKDNKGYAIAAVELLKEKPYLAEDVDALWRETMKKTQNCECKSYDYQMDVVISLYNNKLLNGLNGA